MLDARYWILDAGFLDTFDIGCWILGLDPQTSPLEKGEGEYHTPTHTLTHPTSNI
jgi:hypothetical protein